jgi:hypothetical protein
MIARVARGFGTPGPGGSETRMADPSATGPTASTSASANAAARAGRADAASRRRAARRHLAATRGRRWAYAGPSWGVAKPRPRKLELLERVSVRVPASPNSSQVDRNLPVLSRKGQGTHSSAVVSDQVRASGALTQISKVRRPLLLLWSLSFAPRSSRPPVSAMKRLHSPTTMACAALSICRTATVAP